MPRTNFSDDLMVLRDEYLKTSDRRVRVGDEVREEYADLMQAEIDRRQKQVDADMALLIRQALEKGVPSSQIRAKVLRTNMWSRWLYWRDEA